jgi:phosphoribosylaminoimidazole carboxylase
MVNLLGEADGQEGMDMLMAKVTRALGLPGASVHMYGKKECRKGRKMAHVTIVGEAMQIVLEHANVLATANITPRPVVGVIMGSDSDLPTVKPACALLQSFNVPFEVDFVSAHRTPDRMVEYARTAHERGIQVIIAAAGGAAHLPGTFIN